MWNDSAITNVGKAVLDNWTQGTTFSFDSAKGGTGTVPAASLMAQSSLVNIKQTLSLVGSQVVTGGIKVQVQIGPASAAYTLNQIGIWGSVDEGTSTLIAIYQDSTGVSIPSSTDMPDFIYTFYATIAMSNEGEFTLTVDTSAAVSTATLTALLSLKANASDLTHHTSSTSNPHSVTKAQVGLGDVPNVSTNDQTPTYSDAASMASLSTGEKLSVAFGKISKAVSSLIAHLGDSGKASASQFGHAKASATTPKANGTASPGSETDTFARGDHVHPLQTISAQVACTLLSSGWVGSGPFTQTLAVSGLGTAQNGFAAVAQSANQSQREAATAAKLSVTGQAANSITVSADGTCPTVNIPITVTLLG